MTVMAPLYGIRVPYDFEDIDRQHRITTWFRDYSFRKASEDDFIVVLKRLRDRLEQVNLDDGGVEMLRSWLAEVEKRSQTSVRERDWKRIPPLAAELRSRFHLRGGSQHANIDTYRFHTVGAWISNLYFHISHASHVSQHTSDHAHIELHYCGERILQVANDLKLFQQILRDYVDERDVKLWDPRNQCTLYFRDNTWMIQHSQGAAYRTYANCVAVVRPIRLEEGMEIRVGDMNRKPLVVHLCSTNSPASQH